MLASVVSNFGQYAVYEWAVGGTSVVAIDDEPQRFAEIGLPIVLDLERDAAVGTFGNNLVWFNLRSGTSLGFTMIPNLARLWQWTADGAVVTYGDELGRVPRFANSPTSLVAPSVGTSWSHPAFSPDGQRLLAMRVDAAGRELAEIDLADRSARVFAADVGDVLAGWSADGASIAMIDTVRGRVLVVDVATQVSREVVASRRIDQVAWSPTDGRLMVAAEIDGQNHLMTMAPDGSDRVVLSTGLADFPVEWSNNGRDLIWFEYPLNAPAAMTVGDALGAAKAAIPVPTIFREIRHVWLIDGC